MSWVLAAFILSLSSHNQDYWRLQFNSTTGPKKVNNDNLFNNGILIYWEFN